MAQKSASNNIVKILKILGVAFGVVLPLGFVLVNRLTAPSEEEVTSVNTTTPSTSPESSPAPQVDSFSQAVQKAIAASNATQSAKTKEEWEAVATQWKEAIALMQAVPVSSSKHEVAQKKVGQYQKNLAYAQRNRGLTAATPKATKPSPSRSATQTIAKPVQPASKLTAEDYKREALKKYLSNDYPGAFQDFSKAIELDPNDAQAWRNRGEVRYEAGDKAGARSDLEQSAELYKKQGDEGGYSQVIDQLARFSS